MFACNSKDDAGVVTSHLERLQRATISNPPAFGARIVATVLGDQVLRGIWKEDLVRMSSRLAAMRRRLQEELESLGQFRYVPSQTPNSS